MYRGRPSNRSNHDVIASRINLKTLTIGSTDLKNEELKDENYSLQTAIAPALVIAAFCGFFPVKGITSENTSDLRFTYWNWRSLYSYLVIFGSTLMGFMSIDRFLRCGIQLETAGEIMFFMGNSIGMYIFLNLAANWKELMVTWHEVELILPPTKRRAKLKITLMILVITFLSLFEHMSSNANTLTSILKEESISWKVVGQYFLKSYKMIFDIIPFSILPGVIFSIIHLIDVITWNYMNLIIIILSIALTDLYRSVNILFDRTKERVLDREDWRQLRETYNKVHSLTGQVDDKLSLLVLLSIGSNLYFISLQLLNSLRPMKTISQRVYFFSSFGYLLARTLAVCLSAASIPTEASYPLKVLYATPSHSYNTEIQRLITQITSEEVALSGCKFFTLNRNLIITILGTIITYEIVLVQFNNINEEPVPTCILVNSTNKTLE